ncbi:substrate-binding periplasmic protein [Vibrio sinus]
MSRFLLLCALSVSFLTYGKEVVTLATSEWTPYQSKRLKHDGFVTQIVVEAFEKEGYEVELAYLPWVRGYELVKQGKLDGTFIWAFSKEREKDFLFSEPVIHLALSIFHRSNMQLNWNNPSDFSQYRIGGQIGFDYGLSELEKNETLTIFRIANAEGNYHKLTNNRLDIILDFTDVGYHLINKLGLTGQITASPKPLNTRAYSLLISKQSPRARELINAFNRGIKKMRDSAQIEKYKQASQRGEYLKPK